MSFLSYLYLLYENEQGRKRAQAPKKILYVSFGFRPNSDQKKTLNDNFKYIIIVILANVNAPNT